VRKLITNTEAEKSVVYGRRENRICRGEKWLIRRRIELNDASVRYRQG
jgi:hypothetical protein